MTSPKKNKLDDASFDWQRVVDSLYGKDNAEARDILLEHSRSVAALAQDINSGRNLGIDPAVVETAAMIHDIGIAMTNAPGIGCHSTLPYIMHGIAGADLLRKTGAPEWAARVCERHTGAGLTAEDIRSQNLPLPADRVLVPQTMLEKLICYADKFYSKRPGHLSERKSSRQVIEEMKKHGEGSLARFMEMHRLFEIESQYDHF